MFTTFEQILWDDGEEEVQTRWDQVKNYKQSHMVHSPELDLEDCWALNLYIWFDLFLFHGGGGSDHRNAFNIFTRLY